MEQEQDEKRERRRKRKRKRRKQKKKKKRNSRYLRGRKEQTHTRRPGAQTYYTSSRKGMGEESSKHMNSKANGGYEIDFDQPISLSVPLSEMILMAKGLVKGGGQLRVRYARGGI